MKKKKQVQCFHRVTETVLEVWDNEKMLWEYEPQTSVSTAFASSLKLPRVSIKKLNYKLEVLIKQQSVSVEELSADSCPAQI